MYDWSGLLYLSSFGEEFSGGVLEFHDRTTGEVDLTVEPRAGGWVKEEEAGCGARGSTG